MRNNVASKIGLIAIVSFVISIQLSASFRIQCPKIIADDCRCESDPYFSFNCSKNNEQITLTDKTPPGIDDFRNQFLMELNCTKIIDGKIFESMQFTSQNSPYKDRVKLTINRCPMDVLPSIKNANIIAADSTYLDVIVNDVVSVPESLFANQKNLISLKLKGNRLANLPEPIFKHLRHLRILNLSDNNRLMTLPNNIFRSCRSLSWLQLSGNGLTSLYENIFEGLTELGMIHLGQNNFKALPANIFEGLTEVLFLWLDHNQITQLPAGIFDSQTNMKYLYLNGNQMKTLPRHIFDGQRDANDHRAFVLKDNPWICDEDFVQIAREHNNTIDYKEIVCADGVPLEDKMKEKN